MPALVLFLLASFAQLVPLRPIDARTQQLHGVLSRRPSEILCTIFEADDGRSFVLGNTGGFQIGDRIYVEGTIPSGTAGVCNENVYPFLNNTVVRPAFAGVGTLVQQGTLLRLLTDDGRLYGLRNRGPFGAGARVYVRGWVSTIQSPAFIDQNVIGMPVTAFGRFVGTSPSDRRVLAEDGTTYRLDGLRARFVQPGDLLYFEGIHGAPSGGPTNVSSATGRFAFHSTGRVVLESGVKVLKSDQLLFDDTFRAPGLDAFALGDKAFLFGIAPEDYDALEPRDGRTIRSSRTADGYSSVGSFSGGVFVDSDLNVLQVEYAGTLPPGTLAYVAGELDTTTPGNPTLHTNIVLLGIDTTGSLEIGFECAPLLIGSSVLFVENDEGIPFHNCVRAIGGVHFNAAPCAFPAIVDDVLTDLGPCGGGKKF
ncbi:MAG: hypothetical protein ACKVWV_18320 [Planctomycetota bacterium]